MLYVSRENGGRGLIGCENSVKSEENDLGWYVKNNIEPLLVVVRKVELQLELCS